MDDLDRAIMAKEQAVELTPVNHPDRAGRLNDLGNSLQRRFERTGSMDDLGHAIVTQEEAVESTPLDHPDRAAWLSNLGITLQSRFQRTGSMDDLDHATVTNEQSVELTPVNHPDRAKRLNNLGNTLLSQFERTGSMDDLHRSIMMYEQALESTPLDHPDRAGRLNNLGNSLQRRFERTGSMDDLNRAIATKEEAVESTPVGHPHHVACLGNLGLAFQRRFERTGSMDDLDHAILTNEEAVALTPIDHPNHAGRLNNLGNTLQGRFMRTGSMDDLDRAIVTMEQAVESAPVDHPDHAAWLNNLGLALQRRFKRTGSTDDLDRAIMTKEQAIESDIASPFIRLDAARSCADLLISQRCYTRAKSVLQAAVQLLPRVSPRQLKRSDQQYNISQFANLTSRAVSVSLQCGDEPYRALQLLEMGSGVLASLRLQVRSDVVVLEESDPDLARQFHDLRDQLDIPPDNYLRLTEPSSPLISEDRRNLSNKFEKLLVKIRQRKGLQEFLLAPSESELKAMGVLGPIIAFNVSKIRSDAFIINAGEIYGLSLPLLRSDELETYSNKFLNAVQTRGLRDYAEASGEMHAVLRWLWNVAVSPVLDELRLTNPMSSKSTCPRVWWVGSGLLNILPIHAAGYHEPGSSRNAIDCVISSYTPSIKALAYARERNVRAANVNSQKAMLVGMPETPGQDKLPFVAMEINELNNLLSPRIQTIVIQNATRENVLLMLREHQIVHFSCHGYSSPVNPSDSRLLLNDWQISPLTVSDLATLNIELAQLAFLSACHSASSRDFSLLSESINLSSAIQLAGYPSVVGTLWQVTDKHSAEIAKNVYAYILVGNRLNTELSAESLHRAVCSLRERTRVVPGFTKKGPGDPLIWAPFIHLGV